MNYLQILRNDVPHWKTCCGCFNSYQLSRKKMFQTRLSKQLACVLAKRTVSTTSNYRDNLRVNHANIQMLSPGLHRQIFKHKNNRYDQDTLSNVQKHLQDHDLWERSSSKVDDVDLALNLFGDNIEEHFKTIAESESKYYYNLAANMSSVLTKTPPKPEKWEFVRGWTKYCQDGSFVSVPVPPEDVLIFDVEVCLAAGNVPVLATALSRTAWYCWVSEVMFDLDFATPNRITDDLMIPVENNSAERKLLIGHHVAFDRSYIKEQYALNESNTRFLDTLSLHMCVSGLTNEQRNYMNSKSPPMHYDWMDHGTMNSLAKVYEFYCGKQLDKSTRDLFVTGTLDDIRANFQACAHYCATDVSSTKEVFQMIWPQFLTHAPHLVTFAGMLEMGTCYLPINEGWNLYVERCENMFDKVTREMKETLVSIADEALKFLVDHRYKNDPWLSNLDWSIHKTVTKDCSLQSTQQCGDDIHEYISKSVQHLTEKRQNQLNMPGYPKWYRDLCMNRKDPNYKPGPHNISSLTKVTPYLLQMTWNGYPLHHEMGHGWGSLVPKGESKYKENNVNVDGIDVQKEVYKDQMNEKAIDIGLSGVAFYRLPHKDGEEFNVGNPLAKDYLSKIEDGTLASSGSYNAKHTIEMNKMLAFWRNARKRIMSQHTVWTNNGSTSKQHGVILPQVITAGTVTRRAVEPTWLTASNPKNDRIGSEQKSMIQAPEGYCFVGADVDSQELWIASILGDSQFAGIHGSTAFGWMTLQGNKIERTDLHSRTADTIGTGRDQAKIFNYGRIYGAGENFAVRLLKQFNHNLSSSEAEMKAEKLYKATKGKRMYKLKSHGIKVAEQLGINVPDNGLIPYDTFKKILQGSNYTWHTRDRIAELTQVWSGGSESEMFNKLESIALSDKPRTPVLGCQISNALLPKYVHNHYKTSRVNWVVQSSAVDFLHLLLTCMRWLITKLNIDARFCISVHDEVRYIVNERDKYRAALALQISNLLTRSMFSYKLGMFDLPQSVAFFSSVDIDKVWRKEVDLDCITPSNAEGLLKGHDIYPGESVDINTLLKKLDGKLPSL